MHVTSQLLIHTTIFVYTFFDLHLCHRSLKKVPPPMTPSYCVRLQNKKTFYSTLSYGSNSCLLIGAVDAVPCFRSKFYKTDYKKCQKQWIPVKRVEQQNWNNLCHKFHCFRTIFTFRPSYTAWSLILSWRKLYRGKKILQFWDVPYSITLGNIVKACFVILTSTKLLMQKAL